MGLVIEEGLARDHIVQMLVEGKRLGILLGDIERDFVIMVVASPLLRCLQQTSANPLSSPGSEHGQGIYIPCIIRRLAFDLPADSGIELFFFLPTKAQDQPDNL